jgi:hypothetical protein
MSDERRDPDLWDDLAHGDLDPEEEAALRALAEEDPEIGARVEAFRPLGDDFAAKVAARIAAERGPAAPVSSPARRRGALRLAWIAAPLAAAAAIALALLPRDGDALPAYELALRGGDREVRGSEPLEPAHEVPTFSREAHLELVLSPATRVEHAVDAAVYVLTPEPRRLEAPIERAESGALRIRGAAGALLAGVAPGRVRLAVIVARELPDDDEARTWVADRDPRVHVVELELAP